MAQLALVAAVISAAGTIAQGNAAASAAKTQATQLRQQANAAKATASQKAEQSRREADYIASRARAVAAKSGAGVGDKTVQDLIGKITKEGEYKALTDLWLGDEYASSAETAALAVKQEGKQAQTNSYLSAAGSLVGGYANYKYMGDLGIMSDAELGMSRYWARARGGYGGSMGQTDYGGALS